MFSFPTQNLPWRSNVPIQCTYAEQLVAKYALQMAKKYRTAGKMRTFLYKTQFDWLKISFQKMGCQKINSTNVEEKIKPVHSSTIIRKIIVGSSVPKFVHSRNEVGLKFGYTRTLYLKQVFRREHLLGLHTRQFYWPGSYTLRGDIVQCMQRWGLPFFSSFIHSDANVGISTSLLSF